MPSLREASPTAGYANALPQSARSPTVSVTIVWRTGISNPLSKPLKALSTKRIGR
ncbi:MAG: hypothetical protein V7K61_27045 [Nostoc sp.]